MRRASSNAVLMPLSPAARDVLDHAISEKEFQQQVIDFAKLHGWISYHTHDSRRSSAGYPDLTLLKGSRIIFAELKRQNGRLRPEQEIWLAALRKVPGLEVFVWKPSNWLDIEKFLQ